MYRLASLALFLAACAAFSSFEYRFGDGGIEVDAAGRPLDGDIAPPPVGCGHPGEPCCAGMNQCVNGGCCRTDVVAPGCVGSGMDLPGGFVCWNGSGRPCGNTNEPCCGVNTCHNGGCCAGGVCVGQPALCGSVGVCNGGTCGTCGGSGDPCCTGLDNTIAPFCVASGLACDRSQLQCGKCGGVNEPCCDGNLCASGCCVTSSNQQQCVATGTDCGGGLGLCVADGCGGGSCGKLGQTCCAGTGCSARYTVCDIANGRCSSCGDRGEACCDGTLSGFWCAEPFVCNGGSCVPCGAMGEPCCPGDRCEAGRACNPSHRCT